MAILFHQNMRVFGGGAPARNAAYNQQFAGIAAGLGAAGPIAVAGFTEVTNNTTSAPAFGPAGVGGGLCAALGVNFVANIACGETVLANGPEYIAIGVNPGFAIQRIGRIFLNAEGYRNRLSLFHDISPAVPPGAGWRNNVPREATYDYRGVVYVIVQIAVGVNIAVGFLHNLYSFRDQRVLVMEKLPNMMNMMGDAILDRWGVPVVPALACAEKYIGGDFNVGVISPRGNVRLGFCYAYSNGFAGPPIVAGGAAAYFPPPPPPVFTAGGTLWSGNLYDYWFSTNDPAVPPAAPLIVPVPSVDGSTLDSVTGVAGGGNNMSDHCAVGLRIS